jgi:hypothetical protein
LLEQNPRHVIKFMDNVIYARHKMVREGQRSPHRPGIFLNRKNVSNYIGTPFKKPVYNRYTKEF